MDNITFKISGDNFKSVYLKDINTIKDKFTYSELIENKVHISIIFGCVVVGEIKVNALVGECYTVNETDPYQSI